MSGTIDVERRSDGVHVIRIDNPEHRNAMNNALIEQLIAALRAAGEEPACRAVFLRGRGGIFCAGRELRDLRALAQAPLDEITAAYERLRRLNEALYFCPKPTVAVVEKYAFGLGATMLSWCDIAIAAAGAQIAYPEVHHGITPSPAVMAMLRGLGRKATMDLLLTGRRVGTDEALRIGLVSRVVAPEALEQTLAETATALLRGSPSALQRTKAFVWHSEDAGHRAGMASAVDSISAGLASPEAREGIGAFLDKRQPGWAR